jgi:GcrA cell cycle regulator
MSQPSSLEGRTMEWTEERTNLLKTLWLQGQTASQIAERLGGITRNAVIGKAHRMGLSSRPSPIRQRTTPRPAAASAPVATAPRIPVAAAPAPTTAAPTAAPPRAVKAAPGSRACMWPMGDPKQPGFHFCGAPAEPGRPYCGAHCTVAYHKKADAAA